MLMDAMKEGFAKSLCKKLISRVLLVWIVGYLVAHNSKDYVTKLSSTGGDRYAVALFLRAQLVVVDSHLRVVLPSSVGS